MTKTRTITDHDVLITATHDADRVRIHGYGGSGDLPVNSGAHRFNFRMQDNTNLNVRFNSLDTADDCSDCPPPQGENSRQIVGVAMNNNRDPRTASFTDNNNNSAKAGSMDVSYQWNFTCDDPDVKVDSFDPIIRNGGET